MSKKTVLHVITSLHQAGAQRVLQKVVESKSTAYKHVVVSLISPGIIGEELAKSGILVFYLGEKTNFGWLGRFVELVAIIRRHRPKVVQTWMYHADLFGGIAAKLAGVNKVIWTIHHDDPKKTKLTTKMIAKFCVFLSPIVPTNIIACSRSAYRAHSSYGYKQKKMIVIENGIDLSTFSLSAPRDYSKAESYRVVHVARWHPIKDHSTFIKAASIVHQRLKNVHFVLVGANVDGENLPLVRALNVAGISNVTSMLGERYDIPDLLPQMDVYAQSSVSESFSLSLVEALAAGLPCVSTCTGVAIDLEDSICKKVPIKDFNTLAELIVLLLKMSKAEKLQLGRRARIEVGRRFSEKAMLYNHERLYTNS